MNDLISRQAAIATAISGRVRTLPTKEDGEDWIRVNEVRESLLNLPTASPQWIPVTEQLPEAQTEVIVSCTDDSGDTKFRYTSSGWITTDKEYWIVDNEINNFVVAWREMPEPWKGEDDAKNDSN